MRNFLLAGAVFVCCFVTLIGSTACSQTTTPAPTTKKIPASDTYHGVVVDEEYRWLEDPVTAPAVRQWSDRQTAYARSILDSIPNVDALRERVTEILAAETEEYFDVQYRGGKYFMLKRQPPKQQPFIVMLRAPMDTGSESVVVDPNEIDPEGSTSIDWFEPSPDGSLVAVSLSVGGTEVGDLHFFETSTGKQVHEVVPRVNTGTAGGDIAWAPDGSGVYYTRHPRSGERPPEDMNFYQQVYFHVLGTSTEGDRYELGKDSPRIAETQVTVDDRTGRVIATIQDGDGGEFAHYLRSAQGNWQQFSHFGDRIVQAEFGPRDDLFLVSRADAPRGKILHLPIDQLNEAGAARVVIPEGEDSIVTSFWGHASILPTATQLYVTYQLGGPSEIRVFDFEGEPRPAPRQLPISNVYDLTHIQGDDILFGTSSYLQPDTKYMFRAESGETIATALTTESPVEFDDVEVVREFARSKDGTMVPVNIMLPKGTERDGQNYCLAYGYGGYGVSITPTYSAMRRVLMDHGIIFAVANLRGGGEYGEEWHLEGNLTNKQNVFDDFAAVLEHLIQRKYTNSDRLALIGGSNGGLLMGAMITQHPHIAKVVLSFVGIYDMLRVELSPNGEFNVTEFGTVKNPDHFRALYAYSPYHNVKDGAEYPAVLFVTGENDPRVEPMHSRKMTARLQAATSSGYPILLRTSADSGHGGDTALDERIEQTVDAYAFLFDQLGIEYQAENE